MAKANYKKKKRLKNIGTATALTITLATSNVPTLAYAMELENDINEEVVVEDEEKKKKPTIKEEINIQDEVTVQEEVVEKQTVEITEKEESVEVVTEEVKKDDAKSTVDNFNLAEWDYKMFSKTVVLDKYKGDKTDVVIPGQITVTEADVQNATNIADLKNCPAGDKVVKMGTMNSSQSNDCFAGKRNTITSLKFEEKNGEKVEFSSITKDTFTNFISLTNIDLSGADTSTLEGNISGLFNGCDSLENVNLSNADLSSVTNMSNMFKGLDNLESVDLSEVNISNVTNMSNMFKGCTSLQEINLSGVNATALTNMRSLFEGCSALTTLNLEGSNIEFAENTDENGNKLATNMDNMFKNCSSLTNLNLSNFNTSNVTTMRSVFEGCKALTSLDLSSFNTVNVDNMNNMFKDCTNLNKITFGDKFKTENVTSMAYMFSDSGVESLDLSSFNTQNVKKMMAMFRNTENLNKITFGKDFETGNVTNMSFMFCNSGVESLDLSNFNTQNVEDMKAMFASLDNIKVLNLSNFNLDSVLEGNMEYMFAKHISVASNSNDPSENKSEELKKSLLVISTNKKLTTYDYEADYCLPGHLTLDANGGEFKDGDKASYVSLETNVVGSVAAFIEIKNGLLVKPELEPIRAGYKFISWEAKHLDKLNTDYEAKWQVIPGEDFDSDMNVKPELENPGEDFDSDMNVKPEPENPGEDFDSDMGVIPEDKPVEDVKPEEDEEQPSIKDVVNEGGVGSTYDPVNLIVNTLKGLEKVLSSIVNSESHISLFRLEDQTTIDENKVVYKLHVIDGDSSYYIDIKVDSNANELTDLLNKIPKINDEENQPPIGDENQENNNDNSSTTNPGNGNSSNESTSNSGSNNNPQTGDVGVLGSIGLGLTSILGIFINNRKKKK